MAQNLISLDLTDNLPKFDAALDAIEQVMDIFVSLTPEQVRRLTKIGDKSETFCRQTTAILEQNQQAVPPGFDLEELKRDLAAYDALRPRLLRLQALTAKCADTRVALGSDIQAASYDGYGLLKMFGKADNVAPLQESMRSNVRRKSPAPGQDAA
ncbi:hypothetical protein [Zoogloea sp.]|uniref:hypothetical protein n=1 Tax=Zoogloea sp. TaxID=49181 RepID=UPI0035AF07AA